MPNNILLLGVGQDQLIMIKHARELGWGVIGFDGNPKAEGVTHCDHFVHCDIRNPDEVECYAIELNKKVGIDAVMAPATEMGISCGRVVDKLGLIGIGERTARSLTIKTQRRLEFKSLRVLQPMFDFTSCGVYQREWLIFPCIIKPSDKMASVGVRYIENAKELAEAKDWDIVEEYLEGWELSTEVLVFNGFFMFATADRNYDKKLKWKPQVMEDGCQFPSKISPKILKKVENIIGKLVRELKLVNCAIKLDLLVKDNLIYVIECAPRLGGGKLSSTMIPKSYGLDWWKTALKLACGIPISPEELQMKRKIYTAQRYRFPDSPKSHKDRLSDVICEGATYEEAVTNAERAIT